MATPKTANAKAAKAAKPQAAPAVQKPAEPATPHTSAPASPGQPADVSATRPAESIPPAGEPAAIEPTGGSPSDEAEKLPPGGGRKYKVLSNLDHDGVRYAPDSDRDEVVLTDAQAAALPAGVVEG